MGVVYRARHVLIDRVVALKLIRPDLKSETHLRAWMLREARAANRVDHAHIVDIHDVGETEENDLYLVMEYLVGTSLSSEIGRGAMPFSRAVDILEQMCAALARAHDLGVIHRDLKSDNIMMTNRGGRKDFVKILDFGLAALARDPRLAPKGAVFGTPEYMSPEQARGEDAVASSDLYALGVLFYEMLTGQLPFRSSDRETLLEMQRSKLPQDPIDLRKDLPEPARRITLTLLEKEVSKRFRDAHHLKEELKALQRSLPSNVWEDRGSDKPQVAPEPPPPAPTPGVVEWSRRASNFLRLVSRAYPNGDSPLEVQDAAGKVWDLAARASRLEGELATHAARLESMEKRGRALRAEIGRKVEDLSAEESRAWREGQAERERAKRLERSMADVREELKRATSHADEVEQAGGNPNLVRQVYERHGGLKAQLQTLEEVKNDYVERAEAREAHAQALRAQIQEFRDRLQRQGEALEVELQGGRERIATRVREALTYEQDFSSASDLLLRHVDNRPECRELLDEVRGSLRQQEEASDVTHVPDQVKDTWISERPN